MNTMMQKTIFFLTFFIAQSFMQEMLMANKEISISAHALSVEESLSAFYRNFHEERIFPVEISIENKADKAQILSSENILIEGATLLTLKELKSQISTSSLSTLFLTICIFPLGLINAYHTQYLKDLEPTISQYSISDDPIIIEPGQTLKTMLFAQFDYPKDIDGKRQAFIAPKDLDITITLKGVKYLLFQSKTVLKVNVVIP